MLKIFKSLVLPALLFGGTASFAQSDVSALIKSGPADARLLAQAYLNPLFKGFGIGLNSGWNNSAHSKNLLRFDLRFGVTGAFVPDKDETFDVTKLGLSNAVRPSNASLVIAPTVAGKSNSGPGLDIYDPASNQKLESFTLPQGANIPFIPAPQLQGSIGLPKGIELSLRAMPKIDLGDDIGSIGMYGGGVKVEILPLILGAAVTKLFPVDLALAVGYTQFNYKLPLTVNAPSGSVPKDAQQSTDFSNQMVDAEFSGVNFEGIVSKKFLFFTPFLSIGYQTSKTDATLKGNYPIVTGANFLTGTRTYTTFANPVSIKQNDVSGLRTNVGFQLNLAFFRVYSSYSFADYNSFNFGLGFGVGK